MSANLNTPDQYLEFLKGLKARATHVLSPINASRVIAGESEMNERLDMETGVGAMIKSLEAEGRDENWKRYAEKVRLAHSGDVTAKAEVTQIREIRTNNFLFGGSKWLSFMDTVNLAPGTLPYWVNTSRQETKAAVMAQTGRPRLSQIVQHRSRTFAEWKRIASEAFEYPLVDPLRPNVMEETKALIDIAADLDEQISQIVRPFVTGACVASWTNSGSKGSTTRTFVLHSNIASGNIPAGNQIDASSGARWSKTALDKIIEYCASWGTLFDKRMLRPQFILIPAKDYYGILSDITLTSQNNAMVEEIVGTGVLMNYAGFKFVLIPDETLSPDVGSGHAYAYVKFDRSFGELYTMSAHDEFNDDVTTYRRDNKGIMDMSKFISTIVPLPNYPFVARVQYK